MSHLQLRTLKNPKIITLSAVTALAASLLTGCGGSGDAADSASSTSSPAVSAQADPAVTALIPADWKGKAVKVAIYGDAPPGSFVENGKLSGWVPEFSATLATVTGLKFEVQETASFDVLIPGLKSGRFDMAPDLFYITPERMAQVDLVTMSKVGTNFGVKKGADIKVNGKNDLCGLTVATLAGSAFPDIIGRVGTQCKAEGKKDISVQTYPNNSAGSMAVINGRANLYAATTDQLAYLNKQTKGALVAQPFIYAERLEAIALPKGSPLAPVLEAGVNSMIKSGAYAAILKKWGLDAMSIDKSTTNPTETIAY